MAEPRMRVETAECPCCDGELYVKVAMEDGIFRPHKTHPPIKQDKQGHFMKCPHCSKRIALIPAAGTQGGFDLDAHQDCK